MTAKSSNEGFLVKEVKSPDLVLRCSLCDSEAVRIKIQKNRVVFGNTLSYYSLEKSANLVKALKDKRLKDVERLSEEQGIDGLDYYCRRCDKVYCSAHVKIRCLFEEDGWYDDTEAKCPKGHTWIIDD